MISSRFDVAPPARNTPIAEHPSVSRGFLDLTRDAVQLAELQTKLVKKEAGEGLRGLVLPIVALTVALVVGLGTVPVALISLAQALIEFAMLGSTVSYGIAAAVGLILAIVTGFTGWLVLKQRVQMFDRSSAELKRNVIWFKKVIGGNE